MSSSTRCALLGIVVLLAGCANGSLSKRDGMFSIAVPSQSWSLEFPAEELKVETADHSKPYYFFTNPRTGLNISFSFDESKRCVEKSSEGCRNFLVRSLKARYPGKKNWQLGKIGDVYVSENMDGPVQGFNFRQQHMNAHYVMDWIWIDLHLSKVEYRDADRDLFLNFVRSIKVKKNQ